MQNVKKIGLLLVMLLILNGCSSKAYPSGAITSLPSQELESDLSYSAPDSKPESSEPDYNIKGTIYKGGDDLKAGQYVIVADGSGYNGLAVFYLTKDMSGAESSIIAIENFKGRSIINLAKGQYLTVSGAKVYPVLQEPAINTSAGTLPEGMYLVGREINKGTYKVRPAGAQGTVRIWYNADHTSGALASVTDVSKETSITLKAGQYIQLTDAELIL